MESSIIAYCGITCSECDAYQATQASDQERLERVAAAWREQFSPDITAETLLCDGCLVDEGRLCSYCDECPIRACAREKDLASCAHCSDYEACDRLKEFFGHAPEMRDVLDGIRASSMGTAAD